MTRKKDVCVKKPFPIPSSARTANWPKCPGFPVFILGRGLTRRLVKGRADAMSCQWPLDCQHTEHCCRLCWGCRVLSHREEPAESMDAAFQRLSITDNFMLFILLSGWFLGFFWLVFWLFFFLIIINPNTCSQDRSPLALCSAKEGNVAASGCCRCYF